MSNNNYDNLVEDHEQEFLKDMEIGRFVLGIGAKASGKSYLMTSYLKHALYNNTYKHIHIVLPVSIKGEANNSYAFLENQKHVLIYPHYREEISKRVDKDRQKGKTLFIIDDASGELLKNIDNTLIQLITTTRHYKGCSIWICVHSAKKILMPIVRQNLDHLFIYRIVNVKLLQDMYDEYFSMMFNSFEDFKIFYLMATQDKNTSIHYSLHQEGIDPFVKDWQINLNKDKITLKPTQSTYKKPEPKQESKRSTSTINLFKKYKTRFPF